jgi:hypothetical protein
MPNVAKCERVKLCQVFASRHRAVITSLHRLVGTRPMETELM